MVGIAKLVIAPDCGSGGPGFESLYSPFPYGNFFLSKFLGHRQAVRHRTLTPASVGSNPTGPGMEMGKARKTDGFISFSFIDFKSDFC